MNLIKKFKNDLADNEAARKTSHATVDVVHDSIKASLESGVAAYTDSFSCAPAAPLPVVEKAAVPDAAVVTETKVPVDSNGNPNPAGS